MRLLVKICGVNSEEAVEAAISANADLIGFVFFGASPRHLAFEEARRLGATVRGRAGKVALSVDADDAALTAIVDALAPDGLQLHGRESPDRVSAIRRRFGLPVTKALAIGTRDDLAQIDDYADVADRLLFDAKPPRSATRPGGLGQAFDWSLLRGAKTPVPFLLSGGLDPRNIAEAIRIVQPDGVDVSSGVERAPGAKDPDLIRDFIRAARNAASAEPMTVSAS